MIKGEEEVERFSTLEAELLGRSPHVVHGMSAHELLKGKRVLVTGAAGSIGSELARQAHALGAQMFFLDCDESRLHALQLNITGSGLLDDPSVVLADIRDTSRIRQVFRELRPDLVYHAAAHKHLPLLERYPSEGVKTNVLGTQNLVKAAIETGVERFVLVSTDKAADPTSILGATKRLAEQIVGSQDETATRFASVRFGNVLGSRGSFLDTLRHQIRLGLPISITDRDVERYFMTVPEAVGLVIEASVMATSGETYVLDMGRPIRIVDIVERYARFVGAEQPAITFVGLRPGEKLSERLFSSDEAHLATSHERIWKTPSQTLDSHFDVMLTSLFEAAANVNDDKVRETLAFLTQQLAVAA